MNTKSKCILAFVDAPDPDNFALILGIVRLFPRADVRIVLTGRPVRFGATKEHALWDYDSKDSQMAQQASAARIKNFLRHFGVNIAHVYDGGIAPRTLVPHWIHFEEYYKFLDLDPLLAMRHSELDPLEDLIRVMKKTAECVAVVGGPMTGLAKLIERSPEVAGKIQEIHAMFATWGEVKLMQMDDKPRGALQFNVACDPAAAFQVLTGMSCPVYLMPSEVTRVRDIGFQNAQALRKALPDNEGTRALYNLYAIWYDAAVKPRQDKNPGELIFIHDLSSAFSLHPRLRKQIYEVVPIQIDAVPHLLNEVGDWGKVLMRQVPESANRFAGRRLKPSGAKHYLKALRRIFEST